MSSISTSSDGPVGTNSLLALKSECLVRDCLYCKFSFDGAHPSKDRKALPSGPNADGRPVWEPPVFCYSTLIDEEHDKKREAVLKHFGGDRVKATEFMDLDTEFSILDMFLDWINDNRIVPQGEGDLELTRAWFDALALELSMDSSEVFEEYEAFNLYLEKGGDDEWVVKLYDAHPDFRRTAESQFSEDFSSSCPQHGHLHASNTQPHLSGDLHYTFISHDQFQDTTSPSPEPPLTTTFVNETPAASQTSPSLVIDPSPTSNQNTPLIEMASGTEAEPGPFDLFTLWA